MRNILFLASVVIGRIVMALAVLVVIYNPWLSLSGWVFPGRGLDAAVYEQNWLFKVIAALVAGGVLWLFVNTMRKALGGTGIVVIAVIAGLIAYIPFHLGWLAGDTRTIVYAMWFGVAPTLLGLGLSAGYVNRYFAGTLQTQALDHHQHPSDAASLIPCSKLHRDRAAMVLASGSLGPDRHLAAHQADRSCPSSWWKFWCI